MYLDLATVALRTGERVQAAVICAPDPQWADRLESMLRHKGDPWIWQNSELLRANTGLDARFFVLHRDGRPFAHLMIAACDGIALLGHVWTEPADRGGGASSLLFAHAMADFRRRGGRALFLGTELNTAPWHYYARRGFEPIEPGSGYLAQYFEPRPQFETSWFAAADAVIEPLSWAHWPAAAPLFLSDGGGVVRLAATQLLGRGSSEGALLPLLREQSRRRKTGLPPSAYVLRASQSGAVLGIGCRHPDPLWPQSEILDVFCHPRWWHRAGDLLVAMRTAPVPRMLAYCDSLQAEKRETLESAGFQEIGRLPKWVQSAPADASRVDVSLFIRE